MWSLKQGPSPEQHESRSARSSYVFKTRREAGYAALDRIHARNEARQGRVTGEWRRALREGR